MKARNEALANLREIASKTPWPTAADPPAAAVPSRPLDERRIGRPPAVEETMQISLRLPKAWHAVLRRRAVEASGAEDKTISPQEIVRRLVGKGLGIDG